MGERHLPLTPSKIGVARKSVGWNHVRLSVVVPIGAIVAVAIICIVVAVLGSAQRADEVALDTERQLFIRALANRGDWSLRKIEAITAAQTDAEGDRGNFDFALVRKRIGVWLNTLLDHDFVLVADSFDQLVNIPLEPDTARLKWTVTAIPDLTPTIQYLRGRISEPPPGSMVLGTPGRSEKTARIEKVTLLQTVANRLAIVTAVTTPGGDHSLIVMGVVFIKKQFLDALGSRLQLKNLRQITAGTPTVGALEPGDYLFTIDDRTGRTIAQFAWTPKHPGAEIVNSVIPFIAIALAGFAVLAGLGLGYMRRTAATIAAGESQLRHLALHDPLCGLPNRIYFGEQLEAMIDQVREGAAPAAVFYIDLDHFKDVNDTLGHPVGDELIRNVTERLTRSLRGNDMVARLGGDEFAVITGAGADHQNLQAIANRLIATLCAPYTISTQTISIGASIGIAVIHKHVGGASDVMRHADMALYRAKNEGRNRACIYDNVMDTDLLKRKQVENDLRSAIEKDELVVAYQPIVNNSGETVVAVEALCRWRHPVRGEISPAEFIPIAENSGLIIELGEKVLRRACLDGKAWPGVSIAVNVSPLQFRRGDFVDVVERILSETDFDPTRLELEVTESTLLGNVDTAELAMFRLKALGVRLALDDFGTGYSSLLYLRRFPFDKLKIDRSFVHSIERAADAAAIVHAVVSLGRGLGMKVTAEGVETAEQHLFLRAAGVHSMQGYRFGRPCPAADISARLAAPGSFRIADDTADLALAG